MDITKKWKEWGKKDGEQESNTKWSEQQVEKSDARLWSKYLGLVGYAGLRIAMWEFGCKHEGLQSGNDIKNTYRCEWHLQMWMTLTFEWNLQLNDTYIWMTLACEWHLHVNDTYVSMTLTCQWHLHVHDTYISMTLTCQWHLHVNDTYISMTLTYQWHLHVNDTYMSMTLTCQCHLLVNDTYMSMTFTYKWHLHVYGTRFPKCVPLLKEELKVVEEQIE